MAFETGVPSTLDGLLQNIISFAVNNAGFTEITKITTGLPGDATTDMYILQKGSIYWWFLGREFTDADFGSYGLLHCRMMLTTPTAGNRETEALGTYRKQNWMLLNRPSGPFTNYWLYSATGDCVCVIIEITPGVFTHMSFGNVTKFGTWNGGEFLVCGQFIILNAYSVVNGFGTNWNVICTSYGEMAFDWGYQSSYYDYMNYVYYPINSYGDNRDFAPSRGQQPPTTGVPDYSQRARFHSAYQDSSSGNSLNQHLLYRSPNSFNNRTGLFPTYLTLYDAVAQRDILAGHVDGVRHCRMDLIDPKETVEVDWDVYPHWQKSGDQFVAPISGPFALAYKRVI